MFKLHRYNASGSSQRSSETGITTTSRRSGVSRKTGVMGRGKSHHGRSGRIDDIAETSLLGPETEFPPYRTHLLFPGRKDHEVEVPSLESSKSKNSFKFKNLISGSWSRKTPTNSSSSELTNETRFKNHVENDAFFKSKSVSFTRNSFVERRANSYLSDSAVVARSKSFGGSFRASSKDNGFVTYPLSEQTCHLKGRPSGALTRPSRLSLKPNELSSGESQHSKESSPYRKSSLRKEDESSPRFKDCFLIPANNMERFLPDGVLIPINPLQSPPILNVLEVEDPKLNIAFQLLPPLTFRAFYDESPGVEPTELIRQIAINELISCQSLNSCSEGYLLKNMEKDSEFPYINYYVVQKSNTNTEDFIRHTRCRMNEILTPSRLHGYICNSSTELYDEVASIATYPLETNSKKPKGDLTGYIVCMYRVFKGDDGKKFERNWLYWTGARMLYKNLPKDVGLRRITLHKSNSCSTHIIYVLLVECSHFMNHIGETANLLPILRARICGYTGIFRMIEEF